MNEVQANLAISQAWIAGWSARHSITDPSDPDYVPLHLDNEAATAAGVDRWCRMTIVPSTRQQVSIGGKGTCRFENRGRISVELFGDVDDGTDPVDALVVDVREVLERTSLPGPSGEVVDTFSATALPATTDGRWHRRLVLVDYLWSEQA